MIKLAFTPKEKKLWLAVGFVVLALGMDTGFRMWGGAASRLKAQQGAARKQWDYASEVLARAKAIDDRYADALARHPALFEKDADTARVMGELDAAARDSGIQMTMMRPAQSQSGQLRYDLAFRGSWAQVMGFLRKAEGGSRVFDFPVMSIHRVEPAGDLEVTAVAVRWVRNEG